MVRGGPGVAAPHYPATFWLLVEQAAAQRPDHVIIADDHGRSLTAPQLMEAAIGVAAALAERGVTAGQVVSWQLPTTIEAAVLLAALARLDAVQNPLIAILRQREVSFITRQVGTHLLIVPEEWRGFAHGEMGREIAKDLGCDLLTVDFASGIPSRGLLLPTADGAQLPPPAHPTAQGSAQASAQAEDATQPGAERWLYYSSGTTAEPKGARHTDASVMSSANGLIALLGLNSDDVYPIAWPLPHIGGVTVMTTMLATGARLVLFESFDPATTPERMAAHRPTLLGTALPFFHAYLDAQRRHGDEPLFPALRVCTGGGAPIPAETCDQIRERFGIPGIVGSWGLTEFAIATYSRPTDPPEMLASTVGPPSPGVEIRVVSDDGRDVPQGTEGELLLRGPQRCLGYVDASLDAAAFTADGWFRTGDLGVIDADANIRITGRIKDIIIRNAENFSVLEIEDFLHRHPDVVEATVIGLPDPRTGERVCAVVVVAPGRSLGLDALRAHCRALGLAVQKCPEQLEIVGELPRNSMGKVLKQELRAKLIP